MDHKRRFISDTKLPLVGGWHLYDLAILVVLVLAGGEARNLFEHL